ncbi:MAG: hypothetical protein EBX40_00855 [Gammaproteobacteria bacterium]|nr:hypothetical protein [Gammaproteobacteria bacterium]
MAERHKKKFTYNGKPVPVEDVFSPLGALPLLVKRANLLCDFLFGEPLKVHFRDDPQALTHERVEILHEQHTFTLVMLLYDVLEELVVNAGTGDVVLA